MSVFGFLIVVVVLWIYFMQFHKISTDHRIFVDDLIGCAGLKTGDLILFKAYNNFNSIFHGSYFGHIGMVYMLDGVPMMFEANGIERVPLLPHHSKRGVFLTPLADRIKKYKGRCFWKPLNAELTSSAVDNLTEFINYSLSNFKYDYSVVLGGISRGLGFSRCNTGTDCGQILYLALIKLGLLDISHYDEPRFFNLHYVTGVKQLKNGYSYLDLIEVIDHPFKN